MPRTYFFMGWNRDHDAVKPLILAPLPTFHGIDYARNDSLDSTSYLMMAMSGGRIGGTFTRVHRLGRWRGFGKPMFTIKGDDSTITWDAEAMAQRPFRPAKEKP